MSDYQALNVEITLSKIVWHNDLTCINNKLPSELTFTFRYYGSISRFLYKKPRFVDFYDADDYFLLDRFNPDINALVLRDYGTRIKRADEDVSYEPIID